MNSKIKIDFEDKNQTIIGCIPVYACPDHPNDQEDCVIESCPICDNDMWVSIRKRKHRETHKNVVVYCLECICMQSEHRLKDIEILDLARMN